MSRTRRVFSKDFKSKVVLEALKETETLETLAKKYEISGFTIEHLITVLTFFDNLK
ncbi:transposase [Flavobacterium sp. ZT3R18]|uniref:transposase n=1 Tax=Flavobacterium TaxID=237 RepID=UPI000E30EABD|nr:MULTISPECIES: transposase [Flavobacterium]TRX31660.1 transposase [Flavobacterium sp. ZT3R18]